MNILKGNLEKSILESDMERIEEYLAVYERECPEDFDIYSYYVSYYLMAENNEKAKEYAEQAVRLNPFSVEANYNYAVCSELLGEMLVAYDYYRRTKYIQKKFELNILDENELEDKVLQLKGELLHSEWADQLTDSDARFNYAINDPFRNGSQEVLGKIIVDSNSHYYYVGRYQNWYASYFNPQENLDALHAKCEIHPVAVYGNEFDVNMGTEKALVPIVLNPTMEVADNVLIDQEITTEDGYAESASLKYCYIPVEGKAAFRSANNAVYAEPIPLMQQPKKNGKKLVLNIFVDSLNEKIIKRYGIEKLMPHTSKFFENGMQCEQYYSCSEYTLPSIATYWTGKLPSRHMNLENGFRYDFMGDSKNLAEYFKENGYVTSKIGGNDAVTPAQGYIRGIDNFLFQLNAEGMTVKEIVSDTIEQIETFKGANQFIWLDIVDLHHVAGGFMRSLNVQAQVPLSARFIDNDIKTTVKQGRSYNREKIYIAEMKKIDMYLSLLYHYLLGNYKEEDILVTFFSDHGTAFLVDNDQPFISWQRTNVPLMIRGGGVPTGVCNEVMQATDYAGILCSLAGIKYEFDKTDAQLPAWLGGEKAREYAFSQSIFIGDPYVAGLHGENMHVYYDSKKPVESEFRIDIEDSEIRAVDDAGVDITEQVDVERLKKEIEKNIAHLIKW